VKAADRAHVFHSWSAQGLIDPLAVAGAEGAYFWDYDGNRYLDMVCSWGPLIFGHADPETVDAVVSIAMLQLIPEPAAALAEMVRVLRPGARMAVMVPTAGRAGALMRLLPDGGAHFFSDDEIADTLEDLGLVRVRSKNLGTIQWVRGKRP